LRASGPTSPPSSKTNGRPSISAPRDYAAISNQYARDVLAGRIVACKWIHLACKRHLDDLARERAPEYPYRFDAGRAAKACRFIELLPHVKGQWARPTPGVSNRIRLEPWQVFKTAAIFGWVEKASGFRRFRRVYECVARKNAKSTWAAAVGLFMFAFDGEFGAEVYSGATTEKQAWEVFRPAWLMAQKTTELQQYFGVIVNAKNLLIESDYSRFEPVIGKPGDGASPSCAIIDEYHEHLTPELLETMETGTGARQQPLVLVITTAGSLIEGPCYVMQQEAQQVLEGTLDNDRFFVLIFTLDNEDEWKTDEGIFKANPNAGVSVSLEFLHAQQREAMQSAHKQSIVKTKHFDCWVNARHAWMNMEAWRRCGDASLRLEDFRRELSFEGADLAAKIDLASRCKVFIRDEDGLRHYYAFPRSYVPRDRALDTRHPHYEKWVHSGALIAHEGPEIQLPKIQREIEGELEVFNFACIAFDPWSALQMQQELAARTGSDVVISIPQTVQYLSPAMKELEAAVLSGRFHHDANPVLTWAISNVMVREDANENIFPRKETTGGGLQKIDPASALFNAMNRAMVGNPTEAAADCFFLT
jgi:phage terminase large subunit-like protein